MFHFLPIAIRYDGSAPAGDHGYQVHIGPMYSDARGTHQDQEPDPREHPALRSTTSRPTRTAANGWRRSGVARGILTQPAFDPFNAGELSPGPGVETDEQILEWVANDGETALHPSCTAKMGTDDMSVVDPATMRCTASTGCASSMLRSCPTSRTATSTRR